jgi:T5SS/PEP-CTERM-associated repeat protein
MPGPSKRPGAVLRFLFDLRFRLAVTLTLTISIGSWLAVRIVPRPDEQPLEHQALPAIQEFASVPAPAAETRPRASQWLAAVASSQPKQSRTDPFARHSHRNSEAAGGVVARLLGANHRSAASSPYSVIVPSRPPEPFVFRPYPAISAGLAPALPVPPQRVLRPANDVPEIHLPPRRLDKRALLTNIDPAQRFKTRRAGGSGEPTVWAINGNTTNTVNVATVVGADRFYNAGYTGLHAKVANIEGGTPWRGHETMNWIPAGNIFWAGAGLNEGTTPSSIASHATATSMNMIGKAPAGSTNPTLQRGIAYGIDPNNFFGGNVASTINGNSFEWSEYADFRNVYRRAIVEGIGPNNTVNPANRVDVVNNSWGGDAVTDDGAYNLERAARNVDSILFEGNQTRGSTMVFSAGNSSGANTIGSPATGFNAIVVGALGEFATDAAGTATYNVATTFSSRGPIQYRQPTSDTDFSGTSLGNIRARVDIAAPGFQMRLATTGSATSYSNWAGTSFAAPTVAGGIALMADYAWTELSPSDAQFAVDGRVIRSVLINSADKTSGWNNDQAWNGTFWSTSQALDYATGGGRMNLDQTFNQYANLAGNTITQLINPPGTGPHAVLPTGWARETINRPNSAVESSIDFLIGGVLAKNTELNTTLTWFVNGAEGTSNPAVLGFHNLDLEVWLTDASGQPQTRIAVSTADHNNVEHLSFLVPESGQYLIRVLRPTDANGGTYYSFSGDTTDDDFGVAWMTRAGLQATSGTTTITSGIQSHANVLIAPEAGQTANLTVSGSGTRVNALNRLYVGGTDRGAGGTATLTVSGGAIIDASNVLDVSGGGTLTITDSTLSGGVLSLKSGASFTAAGSSILQFSRIDAAAAINVPNGDVTIRSYGNYNGANAGRLNLLSTAATLNVDGILRLHPVVTGTSGLIKNGTGTVIIAPTHGGRYAYPGPTLINAGTIQLGAANALPDGSTIRLSGGTLSTGGTIGFSDTVGALDLAASSTISLGTGTHALTFSGITGTPTGILTILGWLGAPLTSGTAGDILFTGVGSTPVTTYASFLNTVQFQGFSTGEATFILSSGSIYELVPAPVPEPATILAVAFASLGLGRLTCRRIRRKSNTGSEAVIAP